MSSDPIDSHGIRSQATESQATESQDTQAQDRPSPAPITDAERSRGTPGPASRPPLVVSPREPIVIDRPEALDQLPSALEAPPGATFLAASFELAEALVARGVDSSMIAVMPAEPEPSWLEQTLNRAPGTPIVPPRPHDFGRKALIVVPTYNERANLASLVDAIGQHLVADVLVVDDGSPDGTGKLADDLAATRPHLHVLHRTSKQGIGRAYLAGFSWGLDHGSYELLFEMDADFSHAPWDLPRFVAAARQADLVIGSRYVRGGDTTGWDWRRRLLSRFGNAYARTFLGGGLSDMTAGYRCYRADALQNVDFGTVTTDGYAFQIEMAHRIRRAGGQVHELPVHFVDRCAGSSKMSRAIAFEAMWKVPMLRIRG